jgi:hypothetical protein
MEAQAIYRKSEKGAEAIATRGYGVSGKLRMLLITVDGKKTVEELARVAAGMGESAALVEQLLAEGLIELASPAPGGGAAAGAAPGAVAAARVDLRKVKALATRLLAEQLGPLADELSLRLEAAKDVPQFVEAMKRAYTVVRDVKGQAAADRFGGEVEAQMSAG